MSRFIKDYVEIGNHMPLDALIAKLVEVRDGLPPEAEAEIRMRGDDIFGRHLCIGFLRPLTAEEAACEARYAQPGKSRMKKAA